MALDPNELYVETTVDPTPQIRAYDNGWARVTFASPAADIEYKVATPVARNSSTGHWVVWTNGGANDTGVIRGFVYRDSVNAVNGYETIGVVMIAGEVLATDVVLPAGETQGNLDTALAAIKKTTGIDRLDVVGIDGLV